MGGGVPGAGTFPKVLFTLKGDFLLFNTDPKMTLRLEASPAQPSPAVTLIVAVAKHSFILASALMRWPQREERRRNSRASKRTPVIVRLFATVPNNISRSQVLSHTSKDKLRSPLILFLPPLPDCRREEEEKKYIKDSEEMSFLITSYKSVVLLKTTTSEKENKEIDVKDTHDSKVCTH